jgi:hypothetical protein
MSFTITTDRATTPRAHTLLDIFRHKRNRPNRLPRSPSCASASRNRPVGGGLPMVEQSGHHVDVTAPGVKRPRARDEGRRRESGGPETSAVALAYARRRFRAVSRAPCSRRRAGLLGCVCGSRWGDQRGRCRRALLAGRSANRLSLVLVFKRNTRASNGRQHDPKDVNRRLWEQTRLHEESRAAVLASCWGEAHSKCERHLP